MIHGSHELWLIWHDELAWFFTNFYGIWEISNYYLKHLKQNFHWLFGINKQFQEMYKSLFIKKRLKCMFKYFSIIFNTWHYFLLIIYFQFLKNNPFILLLIIYSSNIERGGGFQITKFNSNNLIIDFKIWYFL